jgi:hypothetical protein
LEAYREPDTSLVTQIFRMTKGGKMARPTIKKTGPMTPAEREARRRARKRKSINRRRRTLYRLGKRSTAAAERRKASRNAPPLPDRAELRIGDAREVFADIADESVAAIITDPPYGDAAEPLYRWLPQFAARVLIPADH